MLFCTSRRDSSRTVSVLGRLVREKSRVATYILTSSLTLRSCGSSLLSFTTTMYRPESGTFSVTTSRTWQMSGVDSRVGAHILTTFSAVWCKEGGPESVRIV